MPADEGYYRDQNKLHRVFVYSSLAMLGATIWMLAADHMQPWKRYQREFDTQVKREKLEADLIEAERQLDEQQLAELDEALAAAEEEVAAKRGEVAAIERQLGDLNAVMVRQELALQFATANRQETLSSYDLVVKELEAVDKEAEPRRWQHLQTRLTKAERDLARFEQAVAEEQIRVDQYKADLRELEGQRKEIFAAQSALEERLKKLTDSREKLQRSIASTRMGTGARLRALPILDAFAAPAKVRQVVLDDLPLDYNFKYVTRYDRCITCHLAADQAGYLKENGVREPFCSHPHLEDLYVGSASKHPVEKFGCTVCHQGQGTATSFDWASHTPNDGAQLEDWTREHGWFFNHFHEWPMYPKRFVQASCLKCHHDVYQTPQADKLVAGYETFRTYGCYGCHEVVGYSDAGARIGPHLRWTHPSDAPADRQRSLRKVGPNLLRIREKLSEEFVRKWVRSPVAFRPDTRMPSFYFQLDSGFYESEPPPEEFDHAHSLANLAAAEIHAITHYLFKTSEKYLAQPTTPKLKTVSVAGDAGRGKELFVSKGCLACHNHKEHPKEFAPSAHTNFGPDLSEVSAKFTTEAQKRWLAAWILDPQSYSPNTYMPSLQLSEQEAADIAAYLTSVPGKWVQEITLPSLEELYPDPARPEPGTHPVRDLIVDLLAADVGKAEAQKKADSWTLDEQLMYLGERTLYRVGCFGCHEIGGMEKAKPIGTTLSNWGRKNPHELAFENVPEYIESKLHHFDELPPAEQELYQFYKDNEYYVWALGHHQREGFLMQKLREPRSFDYRKIRRWRERTRMPLFHFTDVQREAVATFVLGLVGNEIPPKYVYAPQGAKQAQVEGRRLLVEYNCVACHVIEPGTYHYQPSDDAAAELIETAKTDLGKDYDFPGHPAWHAKVPNRTKNLVLHGLFNGAEDPEEAEDPARARVFVKLWEAASLEDQDLPAGMTVGIPRDQLAANPPIPPNGGKFALELIDYFLAKSDDPQSPAERDKAWMRVPPPLIREGEKVQTSWLYQFLRDPVSIRPAVALRMPRFNYKEGDVEKLANFFAANEGVPYPYASVPQRDSVYLSQREAAHPNYLMDAFRLITHQDMCVKCHPAGGFTPTGKPEELGPPLARAAERLRPDWMMRWIANPKRILPYTAMPVNFEKTTPLAPAVAERFAGENLERIQAARDVLINYQQVLDALVARQQATAAQPTKAGEGK